MRLEVTIQGDSAVFEGGAQGHELARILRRLASDLEGVGFYEVPRAALEGTLRDVNGNRCGLYRVVASEGDEA